MTGTRAVVAVLLLYCAAFALTWPRVFLVVDEERYVSQAVAFAQGRLTVPGAGIIHPPTPTRLISNFPPGTSALQAPLVAVGGWRAAALLSVIALVVTTLVTMRLLRDHGYDGRFALIVPGFIGASFFGRLAMSDLPGAAIVALSLWALFRAERSRALAFVAGFLSGATMLFREPLVVLLAPILLGALLRKKVAAVPLFAGGAVAIALRLGASHMLFGDALYLRPSGYGFSIASLAHTLPVYALILLLMLPLGALLPFVYRGPRRAELGASLSAYVLLFLLYEYDSVRENGTAKGIMLASRYMVPALPVFALMAAEVWPRWWSRLRARWPGVGRAPAPALAALAAATVAVAVHPLARMQERAAVGIVRTIYGNTSEARPVITNTNATLKYLSPAYGARRLVLRHRVTPDSATAFAGDSGATLVLLDRNDSEMFRAESAENETFARHLATLCTLKPRADEPIGDWARLRVWDVDGCREPRAETPKPSAESREPKAESRS